MLLRVAVQVDQQIAARDQVEPRKRRVAQQVVQREEHRLAQLATDAVAARLADEEALSRSSETSAAIDVRIHAFACDADRVVVEVGREDLHARRRRDLRAYSASSIAIEYASSPVAHAGTQTRTVSVTTCR